LASRLRVRLWPLAVALALIAPSAAGAVRGPSGAPLISTPGPIPIQVWQPGTDDLVPVTGRVTIGGAPVAGVLLRVGDYELPTPTGQAGSFTYLADATRLARYVVSVADDSQARASGIALSAAQQKALALQHATITIAYAVAGLKVGLDHNGDPTISGRITFSNHRTVPPTVTLYTYELTGTVTDASGKPVSGATVSTRTGDRNFWTISAPTDSQGRYSSLFTASDEAGDNPVPMNVEVAIGNIVYSLLSFEFVEFPALRSARLDIHLPPDGYAMPLPLPQSYPGAVYQGVVAGISSSDTDSVRPLSVTWPARNGLFTITLPHTLAGHTVSLWEAEIQLFSTLPAAPGSPIELGSWPRTIPRDAARTLMTIRLPQ